MVTSSYRADERPRAHRVQDAERDFADTHAEARRAWSKGEALAASGDHEGGLAWLGRAHRIAPTDQNLSFSLACLRLTSGDADGASRLFAQMARFDVRECWTGLALASLQLGQVAKAVEAVRRGLSAHALDAALASVAARAVREAGLAGWCGVQQDGVLLTGSDRPPLVLLDGEPMAVHPASGGRTRLPAAWRLAGRVDASLDGVALLGSPVELSAITRVEGFVERASGGVSGWAWHPASPDLDPDLRVATRSHAQDCWDTRCITATSMLSEVEGTMPLARPRAFFVPSGPEDDVQVTDASGRHVLGSPLVGERVAASASHAGMCQATVDPDLPVDVVIPVHRGLRTTRACLDSVIATVEPPHRIVVVDDASPDPALVAALDGLASSGTIVLIRPERHHPVGFPAAANAGMRMAAGRHVVLLNSDTLVAPGWLHTLRAAACSAPDIGTATPLSNEASIFSYPDAAGGNPAPDAEGTRVLASLAAEVNSYRVVDVPTAHGFCMFIRRDCLDATGLLDDISFAQGYGEENDFCERAASLGFRHVAVPSVYVAHVGGVSFGSARTQLLRRNLALLHRRYPSYAARVADFMTADLLAPARRRLDAARWSRRIQGNDAQRNTVLLVTHGGGGGTTRVVGERASALQAQGLRPVVLRAVEGRCEVGDAEGGYPNLVYALPAEIGPLRRLLAADRPVSAELHHLLGHDHSVLRLFAALRIPYDVWVHDYSWFCARMSFVTGEGRFCGEAPASLCDPCIARWGRGIDDPVAPSALRTRSAADMRRARAVVVPSADVARRIARHAPGVVPQIVPWERAPLPRPPSVLRSEGVRRVAVVGAIGLEKGFDTLLGCARDAVARALPLEFVVIGYTVDDASLLQTGRVFVTGEFSRGEAEALIRVQSAQLGFLPSVWPETWCYALTDIWSAGLSAAVFDIGTPAGRVRESGAGWVLPLGLPASRINDVLLSLR